MWRVFERLRFYLPCLTVRRPAIDVIFIFVAGDNIAVQAIIHIF